MQDYLEELNNAQRNAVVEYQGPSLVIAGAGSGKTRVLTYRTAHLLKMGIKPWTILALTFTNKAAREMKERIGRLVGDDLARSIWMGTFHSIFSRILRAEAELLGYNSNFTIYDSTDTKSLLKSIIKDLGLDDKVYKVGTVAARISKAKNNLITVDTYLNNRQYQQTDQLNKRPRFVEVYKYYATRCKKANAMDFDDLLLNTNILFRDHPDVLDNYRNKFRFVLVDEYQDTNYAQYLIVNKLAENHKNVCVVGDDAQSIYSFRGAKIENILNFKNDYPGYKLFKLEQNYRSTKTIVSAANSVIKKNKGQIFKTVWSENENGELIKIIKAYTDIEEGYKVTSELFDAMVSNQLKYEDFAILYRTNAQSRIFEEALRKKNIPYIIYGGLSFYQRKEIKDLLAYFRLVVNPHDDEAFRRVINYPARGIGNTTLNKLVAAANQSGVSLWKVATSLHKYVTGLNRGTTTKINNFVQLIASFVQKHKHEDAYEVAYFVAKNAGILKELQENKAPDGVARYENLQELLNAIKVFVDENQEAGSIITLDQYMENVSLLTDMDNENEEDRNRVKLMTIHSSKGLEFQYVFIVGAEEELFPSAMASGTMHELEEERRLFYVAMTRAQKQAFVSFAETRYKWGTPVNNKPSRFIDEIDPVYLDYPDNHEESNDSFSLDEGEQFVQKQGRQERINSFKKNTLTPRKTSCQPAQNLSFTPDDPVKMQSGMSILHQKFGKGKILQIEGAFPNSKATIFFRDAGQKQILLKYAKMKIVD